MSSEKINQNNPVPLFEIDESIIYSTEGKTIRLKASRPTASLISNDEEIQRGIFKYQVTCPVEQIELNGKGKVKPVTRIVHDTPEIIEVDFNSMSLKIITESNGEIKEGTLSSLISAIVFKQTIATVGGAIITYLASPETLARGVEVKIPAPKNLRFETQHKDGILILMNLEETVYTFIFPPNDSIIRLTGDTPVLNRHDKISLFYGLTQGLTHIANLYCKGMYEKLLNDN